jgi:hypothetical protein
VYNSFSTRREPRMKAIAGRMSSRQKADLDEVKSLRASACFYSVLIQKINKRSTKSH